MGVPAFFRWLCRKYPSIVMQCAEEKPKQNPVTNEKIPVDTSQPNPSGIEFDNLYLDMNGIIHPCTHPEDRPAPKNEDEMMVIIFEFIDRIFSIVRPRKLLYMAIDGVAPRAKMNQQRSRRFRAAKDNSEKANEIKRLKDQIISNGGTVPPEVPQSEKFDSNCITPGTPFMHKLADCLRYYIHDRLNNDPGWKNICVILSDANVPGEGEHKIMDYIRRQRAQPDHDPNTHHVLCGADADLIMLGLATHEPHFSIIREEFKPDKPRPCEICNQFGHDTKECTGLTREKSGAHDEMANSFTPSEQQYIFLRLSILREYLNKELFLPNLPFKFDIERAIDDWVFMCFFVGNDFLPHLPSLEIRENAIDRLVNLYKNMINEAGGYLTDCGDVNLSRVQFILTGIGEVEDDIFKKRQRNEAEFKQRQKEKKKRMRMGQDLPSHMPSWMKTGPYAPTPLGKKPNPIKTDNKFEKLEVKEVETVVINDSADADDDEKRGIKRKHPVEAANDATTLKQEPDPDPKRKPSEAEVVEAEVLEVEKVVEEEEEDDESNDPVRLWEDGWKQRYYKVKFDVSEDDIDFRRKVARHYAIGLQWVLKYYYQGVPSWGWYFPYHYAPFASDFVDINDAITDFDIPSQPFNPFEQLMAVFPAASMKHVPEQWQILMTDPKSPIIDFYPEDFAIDLNGKKQSWQGVALLPFVDEKRLMKAIEPLYEKLDPEQRKRNTRGNDRIFVRKSHGLYDSLKDLYNQTDSDKKYRKLKEAIDIETSISSGIAGKVWCDEYVVLENEVVRSPLRFCLPDLMHNQVISVHYHDPLYDSDHIFNTLILEGAVIPDPTLKPEDFDNNNRYRPNLGFNRNNDYRNNKNPSVANRMIQNSMNSEMMSSAFTGQNSVYGAYKTSASFSTYSNNNQQQNRGGQNYNNNYNNNGRNYNNNRNNYNNNYNNNQSGGGGGGGGASNNGGNYNNGYNNNNFNNNGGPGGSNGGGGGNNYNNSRNGNYNNNYRNNNNNGGYNNRNNYNNNNANNTNQRFPDNANNNFQANNGNNVNNSNPSNNNQQRQYNRQTTNPK